MNPALIAGVWALVTLDCSLMGYRLSMGRSAILDKRRYHQRSSLRAGLAGLVPLAAVTLLAVLLVNESGAETAAAFNKAMGRFLLVGGSYTVVVLGASALCVLRSVTVRTVASVVIFGPFTLLRPVVVILSVAFALGSNPPAALVLIGLLVVVPGVILEPALDRRIARQLLNPAS